MRRGLVFMRFRCMKAPVTVHHSRRSKVILILSIALLIYWWIARLHLIYSSTILQVIFEIFWVPMILMFFVLPVLSIAFLWMEGFHIKSLYLVAIIIIAFTAWIVIAGL
jgi:hypothetical protein